MTAIHDSTNTLNMTVGIIGAGPAGLTSAKQALARGFNVIIYEKQGHLGGIWNKFGSGAYPSVKMQSSKLSFHFSDFLPHKDISDFPSRDEVYRYLIDYADHYKISPHIRYNTQVTRVEKVSNRWQISSTHNTTHTDLVDIVMIASGELWDANLPASISKQECDIPYRTAKDYKKPEEFTGKRVLVVGGGVSGADIAAELSNYAKVDWSIRTPRLFLPRMIGSVYNDELFSYVGRIAAQEMPYQAFLSLLDQQIPEYMAIYRQSGLLPTQTINNAVHINDRIIPAVANKAVTVRPAFQACQKNAVLFSDGQQHQYDEIIFCTGYQLPNYSFVKDFDATDLYEHFIYRHDPSMTVINTPVRTEAFGTACPYFEMIAQYALKTALGELALPDRQSMQTWCEENLKETQPRHFYDCWLETIRLGLMADAIPRPETHFKDYWDLIARSVSPSNLTCSALPNDLNNHLQGTEPNQEPLLDKQANLETLKVRLLKSLKKDALHYLLKSKQISQAVFQQVESSSLEPLDASLPYAKPPL